MIRACPVLLFAVLACGRQAPPFHLEVASSVETTGGQSPTIVMETEETRSIVFAVVGNAPSGVTFSGTGLPSFATLNGPLLTLSPTRSDQGHFEFVVIAQAGSESASVSLHIAVNRKNTPPTWSYGLSYLFADDEGMHHVVICPGPHCTASGTPKVTVLVCDEEGDGINLEVEVVPRGQQFSGNATYAGSLPPLSSSGRNCGQLTVALPGLVPEQSYQFAFRISDALGGTTTFGSWTDARGWIHGPYPLEFDQGPCNERACACLPTGFPSEATHQCCSGASDPYTGPFQGFFSGTCR